MIIRARSVVTMDGAPIPDGAVAVVGNRIVDVGSLPEIRARNSGEVMDLGECALLPGLINAHCHLDYTDLRGLIPRPTSFTGWIRAINECKAGWDDDDYIRSIEHGFAEAASFGTTSMANLEAFPRLIPRIARPRLRTWWFAEMIDVREPVSPSSIAGDMLAARDSEMLGGIGLAPHAPYTASARLYSEAGEVAAHYDLPLTTHLAESREEMAMFRDAGGPLYDFLQNIGRPMDDCGRLTPLALRLNQAELGARWIVAHLNELTPKDFRLLETAPRFHIAHCPRSHEYFGHTAFAMGQLQRLGFNICLGTDSLASSPDLSLFAEMRQLAKTEPTRPARELVAMATINPAAAFGRSDELGRIKAGCLADLIAVPVSSPDKAIFEGIVAFSGRVPWVMVDGQDLSRT